MRLPAGIRAMADRVVSRLSLVGADPHDDEDMRARKALLVLISVLILPVAALWGGLYLGFGSWVGVVPLVYFGVMLAAERDQVTMQRITQELRAIHSERLGPPLDLRRFVVGHTEAQHCHTRYPSTYDMAQPRVGAPSPGRPAQSRMMRLTPEQAHHRRGARRCRSPRRA